MIIREIDWRSPYVAFAPFVGAPHAHLFHGGDALQLGGWSMIVAEPSDILIFDGVDPAGWLQRLRDIVDCRRLTGPSPAPLGPGLFGYIGYEAFRGLEPTLCLPPSPFALPDACLGVYDAVAMFDRAQRHAYIAGRDDSAVRQLHAKLGVDPLPAPVAPDVSKIRSNFTRENYQAAIADVIGRIRDGDFFQANIAQMMTAASNGQFSAFDLFRRLAHESDAFFSSFLQYPEGTIVSNSPERFFRIEADRRIRVEPIKGTRPRGRDADEDAALAAALLADGKDRAENIMIADLMRNDLSKVCEDGSISEDAICALMSLSKVHHLVSRISGVLRAELNVADVFSALAPAGSITGAPKIEAMQTIGEIEGIGRGPYCGAIGYIGDQGVADFSVAIRTMIVDAEMCSVTIPVGGGITLRSDPNAEYEETMTKARASFAALGLEAPVVVL